MFNKIKLFIKAWSGFKAFEKLSQSDRNIVFYSEDSHSMMHFEAIIEQLTLVHNQSICYLTSDIFDHVLGSTNSNIEAFYIGEGVIRTLAFIKMKADICIMTMPDIESFHLKRSKAYPVHYIYLFHALVSTHSNYRKGAFDHYNTIFCTGPFQINEIRATEAAYNLPKKQLYRDGYRRLETLMDSVTNYRRNRNQRQKINRKTVIVAPTWGPNSILEVCGPQTIDILLKSGYEVLVRPHPMTTKHNPQIIDDLYNNFGEHDHFYLQTDIRDKESLYNSHVMISDWSGVALEYAFSCERPVIYIDVPQKRNNPEYSQIDIEPIESSIRNRIGRIVSPTALESLPREIEDLYSNSKVLIENIRKARDESVFNLGDSLTGAVDQVLKQLQKQIGDH